MALKGQVDVLATHEAPESHALGFQFLGDLARAMGVKLIIHGHHHERYSATIAGGIRVEGIGMARTAEGFFWLGQSLGERV
jgi:predicted phosphodiesterase